VNGIERILIMTKPAITLSAPADPLERAAWALQQYWDAVEAMDRENFDIIGNATVSNRISNWQIDRLKDALNQVIGARRFL
jgi:hypothetical protein